MENFTFKLQNDDKKPLYEQLYRYIIGEIEAGRLKNGEKLYMDIFADKSVFEVYVNERQAIGRRIYIEGDNTTGIYALSDGSKFENIKICSLSSTNTF